MIQIKHTEGKIVVLGHAGYAAPGKDIVCAAISALLQTFLASVEELTTDEIKSEIRDGRAIIRYKSLSEKAQALLSSFFIGCKMIADTYPNFVKLSKH